MKKILIILSVLLAAAACAPKDVQTINVVPYPNEVQVKSGAFCVAGADVKYDAAADERTKGIFMIVNFIFIKSSKFFRI